MKKLLTYSLLFLCLPLMQAQTGPGGVGTNTGTSALKLWLQADQGINNATNGQSINLWQDQSGANNHVSVNAATNEPTYNTNGANNMPYLSLDGDDYLELSAASMDFSPTESTVFLVASGAWVGPPYSIAEFGMNNEMTMLDQRIYHHTSSGNFKYLSHQCIGNLPNTAPLLVTAVYGLQPLDLALSCNSLPSTDSKGTAGSSSTFTNANRTVRIGKRTHEHFTGNIYEVIIYNRKLTATEQSNVQEYLRCKYDIQNQTCGSLSTQPCSTATSTIVLANNQQVNLYPNPTQQTVHIESNQPIESTIELLDLTGKIIQTYAPSSDYMQALDVQAFPKGIYIIRMGQYVQKFIKN